jgi:LmbE family N-acetylglucosaminyl deacetylase
MTAFCLCCVVASKVKAADPDKCIIVLGAHSDDVEQIAGGTLAKYIDQGFKGYYVVLENNLSGNALQAGRFPCDALEVIQHRTENALNSAKYYGAEPVFFNMHETRLWLGRTEAFTGSPLWSRYLPPGTADITSVIRHRDIMENVAALFQRLKPELVITHCIGQSNAEHHSAADLVYRAWQSARSHGAALGQLWFQGGEKSGIISESSFLRFFEPTRISVDVTPYVDRMFTASGFHPRNDYEKRKRLALQGRGFDPEHRQPKYYEEFFVVADAKHSDQTADSSPSVPMGSQPVYQPPPGRQPCILAVGTHTDDLEWGFGGTFAKFIQLGWKGVYVGAVNNTSGCQTDIWQPSRIGGYWNIQKIRGPFFCDALETIQIRQEEGRRAAAIFGAEVAFLDFHETHCWIGRKEVFMEDELWGAYDPPGNGMITHAMRIKKGLDLTTDLLRRFEPDIVLDMLLSDRNAEHGQTGDLVYQAFKRAAAGGARLGQLWMVAPRETYLEKVKIMPDVSVDVTDHIEKSWMALSQHRSQNGGNPALQSRYSGKGYYEHFILLVDNTRSSKDSLKKGR